jgi:hypothetical protein
MPSLAGVRLVSVHVIGEYEARLGVAFIGGLAILLHRPPLAARDATPKSLADNAHRVVGCYLIQGMSETWMTWRAF